MLPFCSVQSNNIAFLRLIQFDIFPELFFFIELFGAGTAGFPGEGPLTAYTDNLPLKGIRIIAGNHAAAGLVNTFRAAAGAEGDHGCTAGQSLHVYRRKIVLPRGVDKDVRRCIDLRQLPLVLRPVDGQDPGGQLAVDGVVRAHQNDLIGWIETICQLNEHVQALADSPTESNAKHDFLFRRDLVSCTEIALHRAEDRQVDAVLDDLNGILLQKGLARQIRQPLRGCHKSQIFHTRKPSFFQLEHQTRKIKESLRVHMLVGAVDALRLPFLTTAHVKMRTIARESPTIMQSPDHGNTVSFDVIKQQFVVDEAAVDVVKMDNVRRVGFYAAQKKPGPKAGEAALQHGNQRKTVVNVRVQPAADWNGLFGVALIFFIIGKGRKTIDALFKTSILNRGHDLSRAPEAVDSVDL